MVPSASSSEPSPASTTAQYIRCTVGSAAPEPQPLPPFLPRTSPSCLRRSVGSARPPWCCESRGLACAAAPPVLEAAAAERRLNAADSQAADAAWRATTSAPLVSLSSRCTSLKPGTVVDRYKRCQNSPSNAFAGQLVPAYQPVNAYSWRLNWPGTCSKSGQFIRRLRAGSAETMPSWASVQAHGIQNMKAIGQA